MYRHGFTLLEIIIVLAISAIMLSMIARGYMGYTRTRAAQQAATVFAQDLRVTRSAAIRGRMPVSLVVDEAARSYTIRDTTGAVVAYRTFAFGDLEVKSIDLQLSGDSVTFDEQGLADLDGVGGVAVARIAAPAQAYEIRFNATGSSSIEEE